MAKISVTSIAINAMFTDRIVITRRWQTVDIHGRTAWTTSTFNTVGAVSPAGGNSMVREEAYQVKAKAIKVICQFRLFGPEQCKGNTYQPDLIAWHGDSYLVKMINDYSSYGAGFVEAECASIDYVDEVSQINGPNGYPQ